MLHRRPVLVADIAVFGSLGWLLAAGVVSLAMRGGASSAASALWLKVLTWPFSFAGLVIWAWMLVDWWNRRLALTVAERYFWLVMLLGLVTAFLGTPLYYLAVKRPDLQRFEAEQRQLAESDQTA